MSSMHGFHSALLFGVCLWSLMKLAVPELRCCRNNTSPVYRLQGEVNPDCSISWLMQNDRMIVDESGDVDLNTVDSYKHSELTMKSRDSAVLVRMDCLSGEVRTMSCTGLCEPGNTDVLNEEDRFSPLIISLIALGLLLLLLCSVGVVVYKRLHRSHDFEHVNISNDHQSVKLQHLQRK